MRIVVKFKDRQEEMKMVVVLIVLVSLPVVLPLVASLFSFTSGHDPY